MLSARNSRLPIAAVVPLFRSEASVLPLVAVSDLSLLAELALLVAAGWSDCGKLFPLVVEFIAVSVLLASHDPRIRTFCPTCRGRSAAAAAPDATTLTVRFWLRIVYCPLLPFSRHPTRTLSPLAYVEVEAVVVVAAPVAVVLLPAPL